MKAILFFISGLLFFSMTLIAQKDVGIGGAYTPSSVVLGSTSNLNVVWSNNNGSTFPIGDVEVQITIPKSNYSVNSTPTGSLLNYFTNFNDNDNDGVWYGKNTVAIPVSVNDLIINFPVTGILPISSNLITLLFTDIDSVVDPDITDNNSTAGLIVSSPPLPLSLTAFKALNTNCGTINLEWETSSERNNDYMEVLRSIDGIEFLALDRVSGTNTDSRTSRTYSVVDNFNLKDSQKYYYRLKQVDFDGRSELFEIISAVNHCDKKISLSLFPNPAIDKVNLSLSGFNEPTYVKFNILNQEGALVRTIELDSGTSFELFLNDFPPGVYHLQSTETGVSLSTKFIKIQ